MWLNLLPSLKKELSITQKNFKEEYAWNMSKSHSSTNPPKEDTPRPRYPWPWVYPEPDWRERVGESPAQAWFKNMYVEVTVFWWEEEIEKNDARFFLYATSSMWSFSKLKDPSYFKSNHKQLYWSQNLHMLLILTLKHHSQKRLAFPFLSLLLLRPGRLDFFFRIRKSFFSLSTLSICVYKCLACDSCFGFNFVREPLNVNCFASVYSLKTFLM